MTTVSVIIPTYNRSEKLKRSINSVLNQTFADFELIVVDDCSTDKTQLVVTNIKDKRIKYLRHNFNKGCATARNTGLLNAKGKYIAQLDDDDEWFLTKLEKQLNFFRSAPKKVGLNYTGYVSIEEDTGKIRAKIIPCIKRNAYLSALNSTFALQSSFLIRCEFIKQVGLYDQRLNTNQDRDMLIRLSKICDIYPIQEILVKFYNHKNRTTQRDILMQIEEQKYILRKYRVDYSKHKRILSKQYYHLGYLSSIEKKFIDAKKFFLLSFY